MKILIITHIYPPAVDGGSKIVAKLGQYFQSQGHQILVLTTNCRSTDDFVNPASTPIIGHRDNILALPVYKRLHRPLKFTNLLFSSDLLKVLQKGPVFKIFPLIRSFFIINRFRPDLIIAGPLPTAIILYAGFFRKVTGAKLLTVPCFHPSDPDFQNPLLKKTLFSADYIDAFTDIEKQLLRRFSPASIFVQPPGVDAGFLIEPAKISFPKQPNILFIANFSAHKRTELLLEAFSQVHKIYPGLSLTLLGQKTLYWPKIQDKINSLSAKINLIFDPTSLQIKQSIDRCTFLCLPSVNESFGLVFAESLARGKPVIGADTPQTAEVIKLIRGGLTFKTDNLEDLILKIRFLIDNPSTARRLGQTGYQFVKNHLTWDKIGESLWSKISSSLPSSSS